MQIRKIAFCYYICAVLKKRGAKLMAEIIPNEPRTGNAV